MPPKTKNALFINTPYSALDQTDKNTYLVYMFSIVVSLFVFTFNYFLDFKLSQIAAILMATCLIIGTHFYFNLKQPFTANLIIIITLNSICLLLSLKQSIITSYFVYCFTIIAGIPFLSKRNRNYFKNTVILCSITILFAIVCILLSPLYIGTDVFTITKIHVKLVSNSIAGLLILLSFCFALVRITSSVVKALIQSKQDAEQEKDTKTRVLSNLGHELRTQINSVNSITQLILEQEQLVSKDKLSQYSKTLNICNQQMLFLVNDILDIHNIESGRFKLTPSATRLGHLIDAAMLPFQTKIVNKNLKLRYHVDSKIRDLTLLIDATRLTQVIQNITSNAIKYTNNGAIELQANIVSETPKDCTIAFSITDTGIGISKDNITKIFDSFQQLQNPNQTNVGGTGLGLSISKTIVEKMNSTITVESVLGEGSTFSFVITFLKSNPKESKTLTKIDKHFLKNKNILIVEDNKVSLLFASKLLQKHGVNVIEAVNGKDAIYTLKNNPDTDLVLLDLEMPEMNGFTAITHIKTLYPNLTVIAFTANIPDEALISRLKALHFDGFLAKPYTNETMFLTLNKHLNNG